MANPVSKISKTTTSKITTNKKGITSSKKIKEGMKLPFKINGKTYTAEKKLGSGAFGEAWKIKNGNEFLVIKVLIKAKNQTPLARQRAANDLVKEGNILKKLNNNNKSNQILKVYSVGVDKAIGSYVVMECANKGDLESFLKEPSLALYQKDDLMLQMSVALDAVHQKEIVHHDVKPANFLVFEKKEGCTVKLNDFGLSTADFTTSPAGTLPYKSPEIISKKLNWKKGDIFALAISFMDITDPGALNKPWNDAVQIKDPKTGKMKRDSQDFSNKREAALKEFFSEKIGASDKNNKEYYELLKSMTHIDPKKRPSAKEVSERLVQINRKKEDETDQLTRKISDELENYGNLKAFTKSLKYSQDPDYQLLYFAYKNNSKKVKEVLENNKIDPRLTLLALDIHEGRVSPLRKGKKTKAFLTINEKTLPGGPIKNSAEFMAKLEYIRKQAGLYYITIYSAEPSFEDTEFS